jgi:hypothetical protein
MGVQMNRIRLSDLQVRRDRTDKECVEIIGATIGGLLLQSDFETVHRAVQWWSEQKSAWEAFRLTSPVFPEAQLPKKKKRAAASR